DVPALAAELKASLETAGRRARYEFFSRTAKQRHCSVVALAHQAFDQVETVLHRIVRGTGLAGLSGMRPSRPLSREGEIRIVRPMLSCPPAQIEQFLLERSQNWRVDHTNLQVQATRNRIRNKLLPLLREEFNPRVEQAVLRLAGLAEQMKDFLDEQTAKVFEKVARDFDWLICIDLVKLGKEHSAVQGQLLRLGWERLELPQRDMSLATIEHILASGREHLASNRLGRLALPGDAHAVYQFGKLLLRAKGSGAKGFQAVELCLPGKVEVKLLRLSVQAKVLAEQSDPLSRRRAEDANLEVIDADSVRGQLLIRSARPAEIFEPLGGKACTMEEFLLSCKIPKLLHGLTAIVSDERGPIWVVGYRLAQRVRLGPESNRVIELSCRWK
ncbi:MAG: tRNA lysidine(34) synthetase TilS, partial [Phycisphaerae bacterium]|nr:tRNA lysidine(34) synthetase TilS [Phycisphaerae bacterium]